MTVHSETDTVVKRILPYLRRRGYDAETDIDFETSTKHPERYTQGYVDLLVTCGKPKPQFLIEAKRSTRTLTAADAKQAVDYGLAQKVPFVIVTNGQAIRAYNVKTGKPIRWNGQLTEKIPSKDQLKHVISTLKAKPEATDVPLGTDESLPFRPGLPLKQLNALFARCHNAIRKIEKDEEHAFDDFSKLLFLKLLEEKEDAGNFKLPYSYRFHELAERTESESDQVRDAIESMIDVIRKKTSYGEVLGVPIHLRKAKTFRYIVNQLSQVSFYDSSLDSKGAAFEYFVRATLKGKKLGQYFTPRPVVKLMSILVGQDKIYNSVRSGTATKILDPACGTGGFLVYLMQHALARAEIDRQKSRLTKTAYDDITKRLMQHTFYGADANEGVACAAKMNMIIAGDGHTNIQPENSLAADSAIWNSDHPDCDLIITNPPFGASEGESFVDTDWDQYEIKANTTQILFLQKMMTCTSGGGDICTVIDDGLLNTATARDLRKVIFQKTKVRAVVRLPEETFKPNKINVRASILLLERYNDDDVDLDRKYKVTFIDLKSLGYQGSGETIRGFDFDKLLTEIENGALNVGAGSPRGGEFWRAFDIGIERLKQDGTFRLDLKYWEPDTCQKIEKLKAGGAVTIQSLNEIPTRRGRSPKAETYVDEKDGFALVVKAGSNITKFGDLLVEGDFIEKSVYDEMEAFHLQKGDVLIASTGTGTLGKTCVYNSSWPAVADGHVTVVRVNPKKVNPFYLADYLRVGAGALQIDRLYTGSTGLIELQPEEADQILVDLLKNVKEQIAVSKALRAAEREYKESLEGADLHLSEARAAFVKPAHIRVKKLKVTK
jgi:type I restriction enzyme M protein